MFSSTERGSSNSVLLEEKGATQGALVGLKLSVDRFLAIVGRPEMASLGRPGAARLLAGRPRIESQQCDSIFS